MIENTRNTNILINEHESEAEMEGQPTQLTLALGLTPPIENSQGWQRWPQQLCAPHIAPPDVEVVSSSALSA